MRHMMVRSHRLARFTGALALPITLLLVAAPARATFGPPEQVSPTGLESGAVDVATSPTGRSLLAWQARSGRGPFVIQARFRELDGTYGPVLTVSGAKADRRNPQVAIDAAGDGVVVWETSRWHVQGRVVHADGQLSSVLGLSESGMNSDPDVAIGSKGPALVVWSHRDPADPAHHRVEAAPVTIAGGIGVRQMISPAGEDAAVPKVAVNPDRAGIVTWHWSRLFIDQIVDARPWHQGTGFGAVQQLTLPGHTNRSPNVAVNAAGQGFVSWTHQRPNGALSVWGERDTVDGAAGHRLQISPDDVSTTGDAWLGMDGDGNAVVAWESLATSSTMQVRARWIRSGDTLAPVRNVSGQNATNFPMFPRVAVSPAGEAVFAWDQSRAGVGLQINARVRSAAGTWAAGQRLSTPRSSNQPVVGVDDAGDALVAWNDTDSVTHAGIVLAAAGP